MPSALIHSCDSSKFGKDYVVSQGSKDSLYSTIPPITKNSMLKTIE
jgi:hypothetical protein